MTRFDRMFKQIYRNKFRSNADIAEKTSERIVEMIGTLEERQEIITR